MRSVFALNDAARKSIPDLLGYSLRREYVDQFLETTAPLYKNRARILDIGGARSLQRGLYTIYNHVPHAIALNLVRSKGLDLEADAGCIPLVSNSIHAALCIEVLEHVPKPQEVLNEAFRVLAPNGIFLATVPFLFRVHGDPFDYGRYTAEFWSENLQAVGFVNAEISKQGLYWSVLAIVVGDLIRQNSLDGIPKQAFVRRWLASLYGFFRRSAVKLDKKLADNPRGILSDYTSGFSILAYKPGS